MLLLSLVNMIGGMFGLVLWAITFFQTGESVTSMLVISLIGLVSGTFLKFYLR